MRLVRKHGLPVHDRGLAIDTVKLAIELYSTGLSLQKVANQLLVPKSTVRRELLAAGCKLRPPKHP
jgi:orotate phosphoribosyltransferase-like protein